jgi:hypothetical protein
MMNHQPARDANVVMDWHSWSHESGDIRDMLGTFRNAKSLLSSRNFSFDVYLLNIGKQTHK